MNFISRVKNEIERQEYDDEGAADIANAFYYNASGYVNSDGYHVEFSFDNYDDAYKIGELLAFNNMLPKMITRGDKAVIYLKSGDDLCHLLDIMGAGESLSELVAEIETRRVRNYANRIANVETANIGKIVETATRQVQICNELIESGEIKYLTEKLQKTVHARIENPGASIGELAKILGISKSGLVNRLRIIEG